MAYDLICGTTKTNWARGTSGKSQAPKALPRAPKSASMGWDKRTRLRRLHHIVKLAAQGDQTASIRLQQIQQNLSQKAAAGDTRATTILQQIQTWYAQYQGTATTSFPYQAPYQQPYQQPYSPYEDDSFGSLNDDEGAIAREEGACERQAVARMRGQCGYGSRPQRKRWTGTKWVNMSGRTEIAGAGPTDQPIDISGGRRKHHLKRLVQKAAQGDVPASTKLQQVQQRLNQRAAAGDTRATTLLQKIQQWYAYYQTQYQGTTSYQPPYQPPYQQPYQPPYQQPYTPPMAPGDEEAELATTDPEIQPL